MRYAAMDNAKLRREIHKKRLLSEGIDAEMVELLDKTTPIVPDQLDLRFVKNWVVVFHMISTLVVTIMLVWGLIARLS